MLTINTIGRFILALAFTPFEKLPDTSFKDVYDKLLDSLLGQNFSTSLSFRMHVCLKVQDLLSTGMLFMGKLQQELVWKTSYLMYHVSVFGLK